jgi:phosphoribosylaminoimidazole-succinocarboxamide synthase
MEADVVHQTSVPGFELRRGKVRDVYELGGQVLIVATDRISAFDCVLPDPIPCKGRVLAMMSKFWFDRFARLCPHHLISIINDQIPAGFENAAGQLRGRAMLCRKAQVVPIECVARGYLAGSGWAEYQTSGTVCGVALPRGLRQCAQLPEPIFTPAIKAQTGHDENVSFERTCALVGAEVAKQLRDKTLMLYGQAVEYARSRGIIVADTKFEFGFCDERLILVDEVLTPDSSRFWPADKYQEGREQESFDKQFVRNYLQGLCDEGKWDKTEPAPRLPQEVIRATSARYIEAYERLTGRRLGDAEPGGKSGGGTAAGV